ncbi:MAG TPA: hypothetical protein VMZ05_03760 [Spirochaetota bacterium]|nr:hypothetical protein [Spirochaetota bacterium]
MPRGDGGGQKRGNRQGGRTGVGPGGSCSGSGSCRCPSCGETVPHRQGVPCSTVNCPKCGAAMVRE